MPTPSDEDALQRICEEVEAEFADYRGLGSAGGIHSDFAKAVARRYAAAVEERAFKDGYEHGATGFIGDEDDDIEISEAQSDAWDHYAKQFAPPSP